MRVKKGRSRGHQYWGHRMITQCWADWLHQHDHSELEKVGKVASTHRTQGRESISSSIAVTGRDTIVKLKSICFTWRVFIWEQERFWSISSSRKWEECNRYTALVSAWHQPMAKVKRNNEQWPLWGPKSR